MTLRNLADRIEARIAGGGADDVEIRSVYAGDRMSDLIEHTSQHTLLVTNLTSPQLVRMAELMDAPALCFVEGADPEAELAEAAARAGTVLMVSRYDLFETCGRLYAALDAESRRK